MAVRIDRPAAQPDRILFGLFLGVLVWAPIPLGSNRPWSWAILEIAMFTLAAVWAVLWALGRVEVPDTAAKAWPALALLGAWLVLQALYVIPLPALLVSWLSPESARVQALGAAESTGSPAWMTLSVEPGASRTSLLKSACYAAAFVLCLLLLNHRSRVATLARFLVFSAVVLSIYAVLMHLAGARIEYFGTLIRHGDAASGTYVNRNHFAGYLEIVLALGIGLLHRRAFGSFGRFLEEASCARRSTGSSAPRWSCRLALCILVIALTTTHSRMGNTAFFASLLIAGVDRHRAVAACDPQHGAPAGEPDRRSTC